MITRKIVFVSCVGSKPDLSTLDFAELGNNMQS